MGVCGPALPGGHAGIGMLWFLCFYDENVAAVALGRGYLRAGLLSMRCLASPTT